MEHSFENKLFWSEDERACALDWKTAFDTDASVALERMRALEERLDLTRLRCVLGQARADCLVTLDALSRLLRDAIAAFPVQEGVFVRETERRCAYRLICGLFCEIEPIRHRLSDGARDLLLSKEILLDTERAILTVRCELDVVEALALPEAAVRTVGELRVRTDAAWTACMAEKKAWCEQSDAVMHFSAVTLSDFAGQVSKNADFSHDGAACNPSALKRTCVELKTLCERLSELLQKNG